MLGFGCTKPPHRLNEETGQGMAYSRSSTAPTSPRWKSTNETGQTRVLDFVSVHDVGRAISRWRSTRQMYGGVAMGLGYGLLEEFVLENGVPRQLNFDEYLIPPPSMFPRSGR